MMPLPLTISCFNKIQIGFTFLVPAHPGSPGHRAVKRLCVCVCVRACGCVCVRACVTENNTNLQVLCRSEKLGMFTDLPPASQSRPVSHPHHPAVVLCVAVDSAHRHLQCQQQQQQSDCHQLTAAESVQQRHHYHTSNCKF